MIGIIDVGLGNVRSIARMIQHIGSESNIVHHPGDAMGCERLVLPGVGSFDEGMKCLASGGFDKAFFNDYLKDPHRKVLGICLGMQMMCERSEEGHLPGLGLVKASCKHLKRLGEPTRINRIPNIGWRDVISRTAACPLIGKNARFYFVHSYYVDLEDQRDLMGESLFAEGRFASAFRTRQIIGVQFHPEKSHSYGMAFFKAFAEAKE